jgi:hypothetical protein
MVAAGRGWWCCAPIGDALLIMPEFFLRRKICAAQPANSISFDCVSRDETARNSAQDEDPQLAQDGSSVH